MEIWYGSIVMTQFKFHFQDKTIASLVLSETLAAFVGDLVGWKSVRVGQVF
jgi:hypothetical protein